VPLKCIDNQREIFSFDFESDEDWNALRLRNKATNSLRMPCCGAAVVLRTSKLGTKHFAHARRGPCLTAPESAEHLLAKRIIVEGIARAQWHAAPEQSGETPDVGAWKADVLASKGIAKVAFEVQWSRQTLDETLRRQERYRAAGVRGLWLFRQPDFPVEKEIPAFRLAYDELRKEFFVGLPSSEYDPEYLTNSRRDDPNFWQQTIELSEFVEGTLSGSLKFAPPVGATLPVEVVGAYTSCWKCRKETGIVTELLFRASQVFESCPDISISLETLGHPIPDGEQIVKELLPSDRLRQLGVGEVKPRYSKTQERSYLSNGCVHCDALQGQFFEHQVANEQRTLFETEAEFRAEWVRHLEDHGINVNRWWFDAR